MRIEAESATGVETKPLARIKIPRRIIPKVEREQVWNYAPLLKPAIAYIRDHLPKQSVLREALDNPSEFAFRGFRKQRGKSLKESLIAIKKNGVERNIQCVGPWFMPAEPETAMYYSLPDWGEVGIIIISRTSGMHFRGNPITYTAELEEGQSYRELHVGTIQIELVNFRIPLV